MLKRAFDIINLDSHPLDFSYTIRLLGHDSSTNDGCSIL